MSNAVNVGTAIAPGLSDARDVYEVATGRDLLSQEPLTGFQRGVTAVGAALPVVGGVLLRRLFTGSADSVIPKLEGRIDATNLVDPRRSQVIASQSYEDSLIGTASDVATHRRIVPALSYKNPNPRGNPYVRFDGVDPNDGRVLIDRKFNVTTRINQLTQLRRQADVLKQNLGYSLRIEVPTAAAARTANKALQAAGVTNAPITVRVVP